MARHGVPGRRETTGHSESSSALSGLLPPEAIRLGVRAPDWRAAVIAAGNALVASGSTAPAYTDEMIETVEKLGPYIVIAPGVALAHSRPSPAVHRAGLSLVTLAEPVRFGHQQNDPVTLVIGLAAPDDHSHVEALATLAGLLASEPHRVALLAARNPAAVRRAVADYEAAEGTASEVHAVAAPSTL